MLSSSLCSSSFTSPYFNHSKPTKVTTKSSPLINFRRQTVATAAVCATAVPETSSSSLYEVLGIPFGATNEEIKAAYRQLARSCHPDVAGGGEEKSAANEFIRVHAAYSTLSDPEKRADYDKKLLRFARPRVTTTTRPFPGISVSTSLSSSFCYTPRRNWETDQCW